MTVIDGKEEASKMDWILLQSVSHESLIREMEQEFMSQGESDSIRFRFASLLANSTKKSDKQMSLHHFNLLLTKNNPALARDSLYYLCVTNYALGEYEIALDFVEHLFRQEPDNQQLLTLHRVSEE